MRDRIADDFTFRFSNLMPVQAVEYSVVLPAKVDAYHAAIGFREPVENLSITVGEDPEERKVFTFRGCGFPSKTTVGMRLEIK
ncbi:hypothetical protein [Umezawaea tangerina]|nr:hypothetical protein [Umezawaea tangerina]